MVRARRWLFPLCLTVLAGYTLAILLAAGFYGALVADQLAHPRGGLGPAAPLLMAAVLSTGALLNALVLVMTYRRRAVARLLAPLPALAGSLGWGAWLWAGDPGDAAWLRIAVALSITCLTVCVATASVGFPPSARVES